MKIRSSIWTFEMIGLMLVICFFTFLLIAEISVYYFHIQIMKVSMRNDREAHFQIIFSLMAVILFSIMLVYNSVIITINKANNTILFKSFFTGQKKEYSFSDLDGYVDCVQRSMWSSYKTIYLVKDGKYVQRISSCYCTNYKGLKEGLSSLNYLGFQKFNVITSFKVLLRQRIF